MQRLWLQFAVAAALSTAAIAQEAPPSLIDLVACRVDDQQVRLSFKFESSPCWDTETPVVGEGDPDLGSASVAIGTVATAEICTMNIVLNEVVEAIPAGADIKALDVSVTTPQDTSVGSATVAIAEPSPDCTLPASAAQ